jgi:CDP-4-dehydro-6-deoxyglucose reductase, E1
MAAGAVSTFRYPLALDTWGEVERQAAIAVIQGGQTTMGREVAAFEERFASHFGARHAVMVNSGSSANLLAVAALFHTRPPLAREGAVAIVPAVSWSTTYFPLSQHGLVLRFVDIDRDTLGFDLAALERALDERVGVVFAANLLGNPNDYEAIADLLAGRDITLIEDNCESMGARLGGRWTGRFGRIGTFSTFFSHHLSTMEGGICLTDDDELQQILVSLRAHGWTRGLAWPNALVEPDPRGAFHEAFRFILPGYNVRPLEVCGAIGLAQIERLPGFVARRRETARRLRDRFSDLRGLRLQSEVGESSWFGFAFTLTEEAAGSRDAVVARLAAAGVESRPVVAGNFTRQPVMAHLRHEPPGALPNADEVHDRGFYIGNNPMDDDDLERLHAAFQAALAEVRP